MRCILGQLCWFLVILVLEGLSADPWLGTRFSKLHTYDACYGVFDFNYIAPNCSESEVIAVKTVDSLAKPLSQNCPQIIDAFTGEYDESCCNFDPQDCKVRHTKNFYRHYTFCSGHVDCELQTAWDITVCNHTEFLDKTNYMHVEYYCIPRPQIIDICSNDVVTGEAVYLWNPGYPLRTLNTSQPSNCRCSLEVSCDTHIDITSLDIRLESTSGFCKQSLDISELQNSGSIGCRDNNLFVIDRIYKSGSHFFTIELNNQLDTNDGYFWIEISGGSTTSIISLSCGNSAIASAQTHVNNLVACPDDPFRPESTPSPSTNTSSETSGFGQAGASQEDEPVEDWTIAVIVICLLFLVVLIFLICWDRCKNRTEEKKVVPSENESVLPGDLHSHQGLETGLPPMKSEMAPLVDPINSQAMSYKKPSLLPPLTYAAVVGGRKRRQPRRYQSHIDTAELDPEHTALTRHHGKSLRRYNTHGQLNPSDIGMHLPIRKPINQNIAEYGLRMNEEDEEGKRHFLPPKPFPLAKRFTALEVSTPEYSSDRSDVSDTYRQFPPKRSSSELSTILLPVKKDQHWNRLKAIYAFNKPK